MMEVIQSILAFIVTLSILVTIHEYGHYLVARLCNVHVLRFSVGFGKPLLTKRGPAPVLAVPVDQEIKTRSNEPLQGTEFTVAAIPFGGFVKMLDEREGYVPDDQLHLAFNRKPVLQRIAIASAGPIANFLLAIVVYWILFSVGVTGVIPKLGEIDPDAMAGRAGLVAGDEIVAVDRTPVSTWSDVNLRLFERLGESGELTITVKAGLDFTRDHVIPINDWLKGEDDPYPSAELGLQLWYPRIPAVVNELVTGGRAEEAGLKKGDEIIKIDGSPVNDWGEWVQIIQMHPEQSIQLEILRGTETFYLPVIPAAIENDGKTTGFIGVSRIPIQQPENMLRKINYPVYQAIVPALEKTWDVAAFTVLAVKKMVVGAISTSNLSGPITIARVANMTAQSGLESFAGFIALISISLGVLNLLPIPMLDGGHILYYCIELVFRRPLPQRIQVWGLQFGLFLLIGIMMLAFYNDLARL